MNFLPRRDRRWAFKLATDGEIGSAEDRRAVLLECATRIQDWPMSNRAYRDRLDSVACELVRLAGAVADRDCTGT